MTAARREETIDHIPCVVEKCASDVVFGMTAAARQKGQGTTKWASPDDSHEGDAVADSEAWRDCLVEAFDDTPGVLPVNGRLHVEACCYLILDNVCEICATIFSAKNFKISGPTRSADRGACRRESAHAQKPHDSRGCEYFYVRLHWTGFGLQANMVKEYGLGSALLHNFVGLKKTWDQTLSSGWMSGELHLPLTGLMSLTYMTIHFVQFRFVDIEHFRGLPATLSIGGKVWFIT